MYRLQPVVCFSLAIAAVAAGAWQTTAVVLEMRQRDQRQDAQIEELEQQVRDLRTPPAATRRVGDDDDDAIRGVPVGRSPVRGPDDAWVTIVAFTDYQCPFCERVEGTLAELLKANPDVRLVVKHNPLSFHTQALPAAIAAECAHQQGSFWSVHPFLFSKARVLQDVLKDAPWRSLDVDADVLARCRASASTHAIIQEEMAMAQRLGARGTPGFFINGRRLSGAQPLASFQAAVDRARTEALASGIPKARYYAEGVLAKATIR
ncbi:MAG: thioredoxin domain-containing protein [Deltaproteobacteria bacterium]|nr:thioredoxin domain-containing protein [Deltaproteobacteria bacterium]